MCTSSPHVPEVQKTPATPTASQSMIARSHEEALARKARGASSTIHTSGTGLGSRAETRMPTLLGQ